jgi:hypothetical protein
VFLIVFHNDGNGDQMNVRIPTTDESPRLDWQRKAPMRARAVSLNNFVYCARSCSRSSRQDGLRMNSKSDGEVGSPPGASENSKVRTGCP